MTERAEKLLTAVTAATTAAYEEMSREHPSELILRAIVEELGITHGHRLSLTIAASKVMPNTAVVVRDVNDILAALLEAAGVSDGD